jgi:hypothetical protein
MFLSRRRDILAPKHSPTLAPKFNCVKIWRPGSTRTGTFQDTVQFQSIHDVHFALQENSGCDSTAGGMKVEVPSWSKVSITGFDKQLPASNNTM